jgi:hypothetical protein
MPNKIHESKAKIVVNDFVETIDQLKLIAKRRRCTLSDIVRLATLEFVERNEDVVELQKLRDQQAAEKAAAAKKRNK